MKSQDNDDVQRGRILSRREVLASLGAAGAAMLTPYAPLLSGSGPRASASARSAFAAGQVTLPSCIVRPAQTEGPYFVDERLKRSDVRSDPSDGSVKEGVPLRLAIQVSRLDGGSCAPFEGALVDIWHCDALGVYSDVRDINGRFDTSGKKFLRGYQVTDTAGRAEFRTIYPGWYPGRTVHIHFKIRTNPDSRQGHEFTSQLYFDDAVTDQVHALAPYAESGQRSTRNARDGIYQRGGSQLMLQLVPAAKGYAGTFDLGLQMA